VADWLTNADGISSRQYLIPSTVPLILPSWFRPQYDILCNYILSSACETLTPPAPTPHASTTQLVSAILSEIMACAPHRDPVLLDTNVLLPGITTLGLSLTPSFTPSLTHTLTASIRHAVTASLSISCSIYFISRGF
jgi:hypothetical protein